MLQLGLLKNTAGWMGSCLLNSQTLVATGKRGLCQISLSWGPHPRASSRFSESEIRLFMTRANTPAHMPRCWPGLDWTQGSLNALREGRLEFWIYRRIRASRSTRSSRLACLSAGTRCPANTSPVNQELLTLALGIPGRWVRARTAGSRLAALCLSRRPGHARLGPGLLGQFYVVAHRACERRAPVQITLPSPPFPCLLPSKL